MSVLAVEALEKAYTLGKSVRVPALRGMDLEVDAGEFVAIVGPSGSGKTTLLNLAGLLDHADAGEIWLDGAATSKLAEAQRARLRRDKIGFIFQTFNLLPHLTAEENVALPLRYSPPNAARYRPADLLRRVGLGERLAHKPDELSGGEQQRVAIARALMLDPPLILADEPTGDLDSETAAGIVRILEALRAEGKTIVVVTHNEELAGAARRVVHVRDGLIVDDVRKAAKPRKRGPTKAAAPRKAAAKKPAAKKASAKRTTTRRVAAKRTTT